MGLLSGLMLFAAPASAAARSGAEFLRIDTGARPAALGGAYTAIADDVNALYYNPGGLPNLTRRELGFTHAEWLLGSQFDFIGFAQPTRHGTFGLGITRLASGGIESRGADRESSGGFEASDTSYVLGFGRGGLGMNVKYLESRIGSDSASTFALDFGATHRLSAVPLSLGLAVLNVGRGMKYLDQTDPLPLTIAMGGAYRLAGALSLALDARHEPDDRSTDVGVGTEYALLPMMSFRAGYASMTPAGSGGGPFSGLGGGFGLKLGGYRADYTITPFGALGNAHRLSLGLRW